MRIEKSNRSMGILARTALLSWLVSILTLVIFIGMVIPAQKAAFQKNLESKARGVVASLRDIASGDAVSEDYSGVVDHALKVLGEDNSIQYIILTKKGDGFSLVHERKGQPVWHGDHLTGDWQPSGPAASGSLRQLAPMPGKVFLYSSPFETLGIPWGWIHVGLSLQDYDKDVRALYQLTLLTGAGCLLIGLLISVAYARRLTKPILMLRRAVLEVAGGNLGVRAPVDAKDEVGELAASFNQMSEAVQQREVRLRQQKESLARLGTDKTLLAGDIRASARLITEASGRTLGVARCGIWLFGPDGAVIEAVDLYDQATDQHSAQVRLSVNDFPAYFRALRSDRSIAASDARNDPATREFGDCYLRPLGITSMLDAPIRRGSTVVGVVCHEHTGPERVWTLEEQGFAASVADLVALALALEAHDRQLAEADLRQHNRVLQAVRFAAQRFLADDDWRMVIDKVLAKLGQAADVCHVYVYENRRGPTGSRVSECRHAWTAKRAAASADESTFQDRNWSAAGLDRWATDLLPEPIAAHVSQLSPAERSLLELKGIRSFILIPVLASGKWWGFMALDECRQERTWSTLQVSTLQAAADTLGSAIERHDAKRALVMAKEVAEAASEAKSQFLANMSHEIRTPVTGVMGMLQLLQRTALDDKQRRYASNALTSAEALLTVIGDVLDFSKIEAGKLELENTPFSVPEVLDVAVRLLAESAEAKGLELVCRVGDEVPRLMEGDPNRLRQVVLNLLSNALKFTERGFVILSCVSPDTSDGSATLRFEVKDTGCGIPPEKQSAIFEAFCQADSSMSRAHAGTGLGLTICRQLVRLMGGEIGVESVLGQGSTFWFTVRLKQVNRADDTPPVPKSVDFRGLRVLVVDDSEVVRELVCEYVRAWHGIPESAPDGATGLNRLRQAAAQGDPFSVAVLDWKMPGLDGVALARIIKHEPALHPTGLVMLSGFAQAGLSPECEAAGFAASLPKPARKSELYDAIVGAANGRLANLRRPTSAPRKAIHVPRPAPPVPHTILLAEDNEINQEVAGEMLSALGYRCLRVRTGRQAVEAVQLGRADLVLMDCQMPEMDGYEATRLIRRWEQSEAPEDRRGRRIPIVALTAHAMSGDRARCLEAGMDDYLTKPLEAEELDKALAHWTARAPAPGPAGISAVPPTPVAVAQPAIDYTSLLHRCMGRVELARRLVDKFMNQAVSDLDELGRAIAAPDADQVRLVAHRLKGSAANVSAEPTREIAARLEQLGKGGNLHGAAELVEELRVAIDRIRTSGAVPAA